MADPAEKRGGRERPQFATSVETRLLYARLRTLEFSEVVPYRELGALIDQDVQKEARAALRSAQRIALRDDGVVTEAINGVGIKRLTDSEAVQSGAQTFARQRRLARRWMQRVEPVDYARLSDADKLVINASRSAQAVISLMTKPKSLDRITAANTTNTGELPIARTLELFRGPRPADTGSKA